MAPHVRLFCQLVTLALALGGCMTQRPQSKALIYGGVDVTDATDPVYRSTLSIRAPLSGGTHWCTATPIDPYHVISAAHCFADEGFTELVVGYGPDPAQNKLYRVNHLAFPRRFVSTQPNHHIEQYDIAILTLAEPLQAPITPVRLAVEKRLRPVPNLSPRVMAPAPSPASTAPFQAMASCAKSSTASSLPCRPRVSKKNSTTTPGCWSLTQG